jgi:thioredoxin 1
MRKILLSLVISLFALSSITSQVKNVNALEFSKLTQSGNGVILDVRTSGEYSRGHIDGATNISSNDSNVREKLGVLNSSNPVYVYCLSGARSRSVANYLSQQGFPKVYNLSRGIMEWNRADLPLVTSSATVKSASKKYTIPEFDKIEKENASIIVDFYAPWCAPCKKMMPIFDKVQAEYKGKVKVVKVDITANEAIKNRYNVESIPTTVMIKSGELVYSHSGVLTYDEIDKALNSNL